MAEVIFRNLCEKHGRKDIEVRGAGTHAECLMTEEAKKALIKCGEKISERIKSTQFEQRMIDEFNYIICMTRRHKDFIGHHESVMTLDEFTGCGDIFDPYGYPLNTYIKVCKELQTALQVLYNKIIKKE